MYLSKAKKILTSKIDWLETVCRIFFFVAQVHIFKSYHEVKRTMSSSAGVDYGLGIFSASASYKNMQHSITNNSDYIERACVRNVK